MTPGEMILRVAEQIQHAARKILAEAAERAIGAAPVIGKYRLQMRRVLFGGVQLLGREGADADHADMAVAPGLLRPPIR